MCQNTQKITLEVMKNDKIFLHWLKPLKECDKISLNLNEASGSTITICTEYNCCKTSPRFVSFELGHFCPFGRPSWALQKDVQKKRGSKNMLSTLPITNILSASKFIVQLFYKTGQKYHCSRTKIEKLLSIANLIVMRDGKELFSDKICSYACGVGLPILASFVYSDIISGETPENGKCIAVHEIDNTLPIPQLYQIEKGAEIPSYAQKILTDVFLKFGNFSAKDLGLSINLFKDNILSQDDETNKNIIDANKTKILFQTFDEAYCVSDVYHFVSTYPMVNYG